MQPVASVIDMFCGAGGLSHGFLLENFKIACGYDIDETCRYPFEANNKAQFICNDIAEIDPKNLSKKFVNGLPKILIGCAPCQPFSTYSQNRQDSRWALLEEFARLVTEVKPDIVSMENVPQLARFKGGSVFSQFVATLKRNSYKVKWMIANSADFGVPQRRSRLILIASKYAEPILPHPTHKKKRHITVRKAIGHMPSLSAGNSNADDPLHWARALSPLNLKRIKASKPNGTWHDWNPDLLAECHKRRTGKTFGSVYGRMSWDKPSPTLTTQFCGFGNGRFGHPEQDRAISLREGALIQSFPKDYAFMPPEQSIPFGHLASLIGNAVPVVLARAIARAIAKHLRQVS